jgi:hypothetical protein
MRHTWRSSTSPILVFQTIERTLVGVCPRCYGAIEPTVRTADESQPVFRAVCDTSGAKVVGPVVFCLLVDPDVAAFCRERGLTVHDDHVRELPFVADDTRFTVINEDPLRTECTVALDDETLSITVDGRGHVDSVCRPERR